MADFFISYNSADAAKAEWIAYTLREAGFSVRFAPWELRAGESIAGWMDRAMADSDRMIAVCSPDYFAAKAPYSKLEREGFLWEAAEHRFIGTIINVVVRGVKIPKLYAAFTRIYLTGIDEAQAKARLIGALSVPGPPAAPPRFEPEPDAPVFEPSPGSDGAAAVTINRSYSGLPGLVALTALIYMIWADSRADGRLLTDLWAAATSAWMPVLLFSLFGVVAWAINAGLDAPDSRRRIATALRLDRGGELYRSVMRRILDWIDRQVSWEQQAQGKQPEHWGIAWSPRLFEGCLLIAIFYPIYSVFAVWAVTNQPGMVGSFEVVPGGQELWVRAATMGSLGAALTLSFVSQALYAQRKVVKASILLGVTAALIAAAVTFLTDTLVAIIAVYATVERVQVSIAIAAFVVLALISVISSAGAFATAALICAFATSSLAALTATLAGDGIDSVIAAVTSAVIAIAAVIATAAIIAVIGWIFFPGRRIGQWGARSLTQFATITTASAAAVEATRIAGLGSDQQWVWWVSLLIGFFFWLAKGCEAAVEAGPSRFGARGLFYAIYLLALTYFLMQLSAAAFAGDSFKIVLVLLELLPLINAVFDFASIGLTRYCLRRGLRPGFLNALRWSLIDVLAAVVLFTGLVVAAILIVHHVRDSAGAPLASLNEIFTGIARDPDSYWWLYLTFFSTLVPTLLHLGVASFSFIALAPAALQRRVAGWIGAMDRDGFANLSARAVLPLIVTLSIALPFLALYTLGLWIADYHGEVGRAFFRLALGFAGWLDPAYVAGVEAILSGS